MKKLLLYCTVSLLLFFTNTVNSQINFQTLGNWNSIGYPDYLESERDQIDQDFLVRVQKTLPERVKIPEIHPEFFGNDIQTNVVLTEAADVYVTFLAEGAGYRNVLGFYTYQAGNPPQSFDDIKDNLTIIFPNSSKKWSGGELLPGDKVKIGRFPAGTVIGWFLAANGFRSGNVTPGYWLLFSDKNLNPEVNNELKQHVLLLHDEVSGRNVLSFEDIRRDYGSCDQDFNDAMFYVTSNPASAIDKDGLADIVNPDYIPKSDLSITESVDNPSPKDQDIITFTVSLTNNGPDDATNVKVKAVVPNGLRFISYTAGAGTYDEESGEWEIPQINNGATIELKLKVKVTLEDISESIFDLGDAKGFNVFVLKDLAQPSSDTEGKVAVGHDAFLSNYSIGEKLTATSDNEDVLIVNGNLTFLSGTVRGGNVVYGSGANLPNEQVTILDGSLRKEKNVINFDKARNYLKSLSVSLSNYPVSGQVLNQNMGLVLYGGEPFLNVFSISAADLNNSTSMTINVPNGSVVLVNISGKEIEWGGALTVNGTAISNVLYNFYEARSILIEGIDVRGTILAPKATIDFPSGVVNGQVIAKTIMGVGQFNSGDNNSTYFVGNLPVSDNIVNEAEIIELDQTDPDDDNNSADVSLVLSGFHDPNNTGNINWDLVSSLSGGEIVWVMTKDKDGYLLSGTWGGKIYRSIDGGDTWVRINNSMNVGYVWDLAVDGDIIYAGTEEGVYKSNDNGTSWSLVGLTGKDVRAFIIKDQSLYAGVWGQGVYVTNDKGENWVEFNGGLNHKEVQDLAIDSNGNLFAATFGGGVYKHSESSGWQQLNVGYPFVWTLGITSSDEIYAGTYGNGVMRSLNDGVDWYPANNALPATHIYSIRVDENDNVFISSWMSGVYVLSSTLNKSASGDVWGSLGMNGLGVSSLVVDNNAGVIYAGTSDGHIYRNGNPVSAVNPDKDILPKEFVLEQNYPNPFNPSTTISFALPKQSNVKLIVYNSIGEEVAVLINGIMPAGYHKVNFNAADLSSGLYFYKIITGDFIDVKKMMLIK